MENLELEQEPTAEEMQAFREEIENLYQSEKSGLVTTSHFYDPKTPDEPFILEDLGLFDLDTWQLLRKCKSGEKGVEECFQSFRRKREELGEMKGASSISKKVMGYVGNKLTILFSGSTN